MNNLAWLIASQGDLLRARATYGESLELCRRHNDNQTAAWTLHEMARLDMLMGNLETARAEYMESLSLSEGVSDVQTNTRTLHDLPPVFYPTAVREIPSKKMLRRAKSAGVSCPSELCGRASL